MPTHRLSTPDLDLIERFISAYNAVDSHLQELLGNSAPTSFRSAVDLYAKHNRWWRDAEILRTCAALRNVLVHEKTEPYEYPCVPTPWLVAELERIREGFLHPRRAIPTFEREVVTVAGNDALAHVLHLIHVLKHSHFPVYDYSNGKPRFAGVLTENGITRWLAERAAANANNLDFTQQTISEVLSREEKRRNHEFVSEQASVDELLFHFHENPYLEAILITNTGQSSEKLLGIITRWDVLNSA